MSKTPPHIVEYIRAARERGETVLSLSYQKLTEIPPEIFEADAFEEIWLVNNQITIVPTEMARFKRLRCLVLFGNPLQTIADVPGLVLDFAIYRQWQHKLQCEQIAGLKLKKEDLSELPKLVELPHLTLLDLRDNQLTALPESMPHLQSLTRLDLSSRAIEQDRNQLTTLPESFGELRKLITLDLSGNKLTKFPESMARLQDLTTLNLNGNRLTALPESVTRLQNLNTLNVSRNQLTALPESFGVLQNLTTLNLGDNRLTTLPEGVTHLQNLTELNLSRNQLTALPKSFGVLQNLTTLNLDDNRLTTLPESVTHLQNLTTLDLGGNQLTTLPESFGDLQNLTTLNLSRNQLMALPESLGVLQDLTTLNFGDNQLTALPESVTRLQNLTTLDLSNNQLTTLPESFGDLQNLTSLNLWNNQLTALPESVTLFQNLIMLNLRANQLTALPDSVTCLQNVTTLDLGGNRLTTLPESLTRLQNLTMLSLRNNQLTALPAFLTRMTNLTVIHFKEREGYYSAKPGEIVLSKNHITHPPKEVVAAGMEAVRSFFAQMEQQGKSKLYEAKLLLVGEPGAGKTSLLNKLLDESYVIPNPNEGSTVGITVKTGWQFPLLQKPEITFSANLWDFGGQEIQYMTHQFFLTSRALYVLLADDRKQHTQFDYWLNIIKLLGKGSPVLVVLNEKNCKPITNFDYDTYRKFYHEDFKLERCEVDLAEAGPRFAHLRNTVQRMLTQLPHIGDELPARWIDIRQALEQQRERNHITLHEFKTLCEQHAIHKEVDQLTLSGYLHDLGVILHFQHDPQLADTLFLNPQWVVEAVYSVLDSDHAKK
ncbi:leucine-rich repeat domain-containing protein [candidate division KSB1 bacterium]|nr:leucine-rich repeat domain-containing protein [candidate division KSB1 bacterium]